MSSSAGDGGGANSTAGRDQQAEQAALEAALDADEQGLLFDDDVSTLSDDLGYRGPTACNAAGITYRQLDYWARTGLVEPTVRGATGSGTQRLYSFRDILLLKVIKRLLDAGISLQQIRTAVAHLRARGTDDLTRVTLMSDGATVYECTSNDEVIDLLQGGQGVFGIAIGGVWREIEGSLADLPSERTAAEERDDRGRQRRAGPAPQGPRDGLSPPGSPPAVADSFEGLTNPAWESSRARRPGRRRGNTSHQPLRLPDHAGWHSGGAPVPTEGRRSPTPAPPHDHGAPLSVQPGSDPSHPGPAAWPT